MVEKLEYGGIAGLHVFLLEVSSLRKGGVGISGSLSLWATMETRIIQNCSSFFLPADIYEIHKIRPSHSFDEEFIAWALEKSRIFWPVTLAV